MRAGLGSTLALSLLTVYAFRAIFDRPGETALQFVPGKALLVASIDLTPSPQQATLFKRIDDAMGRNEMGGMLETSVVDMLETGENADLLRPHVKRSGAFAVLPGAAKVEEARFVALIGLNDSAAVQDVLKKKGKPFFYKGFRYYRLPGSSVDMAVMGDNLVVASEPTAFRAMAMVQTGELPSITTNPKFLEARAQAAKDANILLVANFSAAEALFSNKPPTSDQGWMAVSLALREDGIEVLTGGHLDLSKQPSFKAMADMKPLRADLFKLLPGGAYGLVAQSQPAAFYRLAEAEMKKEGEEGLDQMNSDVKDAMGLGLTEDIVPSFEGNTVIAAYPSKGEGKSGLDVLMVVDDLNGADPAKAAQKLVEHVEKEMAESEDGPKQLFVGTEQGDVKVYRLAPELEKDLQSSVKEGTETESVNTDFLGDVTVTYAVIGKALIASSSHELLQKAIASYKSHQGGLTADTAISKAENSVTEGSQTLFVFSLGRIMAAVRDALNEEKMDKEDAGMVDGFLSIFESMNQPFAINGIARPDGSFKGGATIPLDWDKLFDTIGGLMKDEEEVEVEPARR